MLTSSKSVLQFVICSFHNPLSLLLYYCSFAISYPLSLIFLVSTENILVNFYLPFGACNAPIYATCRT